MKKYNRLRLPISVWNYARKAITNSPALLLEMKTGSLIISYNTLVAFSIQSVALYSRDNVWGNTTGKPT
jgi:hypothetical protein